MKLALVGIGKWALHIVKALPPLAAVVSKRDDALLLFPPQIVHRNITDLPFDDLDGVIIANEASKHVTTLDIVRSVAPNMPVFIEKPLSMNMADVVPVDTPGLLLVDHTQLFNESLVQMKKDLDGVPPADIHGVDRGPGPVRADCNPLWDYGPHAVSVALYLTGFPFPDGVHVRDAWLDMNEHGANIDFELQLGAKTRASFSVGNNAVDKARHCTVRSLGGVRRTWEGLQACAVPPLTAALAAFCDAVRVGHAPEGDVRFGWALPLEVTRILTDIEEVLRKRCTPLVG